MKLDGDEFRRGAKRDLILLSLRFCFREPEGAYTNAVPRASWVKIRVVHVKTKISRQLSKEIAKFRNHQYGH